MSFSAFCFAILAAATMLVTGKPHEMTSWVAIALLWRIIMMLDDRR